MHPTVRNRWHKSSEGVSDTASLGCEGSSGDTQRKEPEICPWGRILRRRLPIVQYDAEKAAINRQRPAVAVIEKVKLPECVDGVSSFDHRREQY